jgi:GTP-binding protein LepA
MATGRDYEITELGVATPHPTALTELGPGEVGFFAANIKSVVDTKIGDTVTDAVHPATVALPGFKEVKPMVFAGIFPTDSAQYEDLRDALSKLHMNDAAFVFEPDTSEALGFGFRCGFLGLLHMGSSRAARARVQPDLINRPSVFLQEDHGLWVDKP